MKRTQDLREVQRLMTFTKAQRNHLVPADAVVRNRRDLALGMIPQLPDQYVYVFDYDLNKVMHARGFRDVLGYGDDEVDLDLLLHYWHPDDAPAVARIIERASQLMFGTHPVIRPFECVLSLDFRVRKCNGDYVKVLRQSTVFDIDEKGDRVTQILCVCKDISNIKISNAIGWQCTGRGLENFDVSDILLAHDNLEYRPTAREMDVVRKLAEGKTSERIGKELFISPHTVNNHRRHLLQRMGLKNSAELVCKAKEQGWL